MSKKRDIHEARVSETYRDLATEATPAHLDRKILAAAHAGARTRYGLARAWMRPLAWAATIALSFAFVLQMIQVDETLPVAEPEERQERLDSQTLPAATGDGTEERRSAADAALMKAKELSERDMPQAPARAVPQPATTTDTDTTGAPAGFAAEDVVILRDDEAEGVRQRLDSAAAETISVTASRSATPQFCDADARASAATWFACIEELREAGLEEAAATEMAALRVAFPDFRPPATD